MTIGFVLAFVGIIVPAFTAFLVAYWHRKQMRQIEAYKLDPSVGLVPPPSALWRFVTSRWKLIILVGVPAVIIAFYFLFNIPVTLLTVLVLAINVTTITAAVLLDIIEKVAKLIGRLVELQGRHLQATEKALSALRSERKSE